MPDFESSQLHTFLVALMEDPCTSGPDDICVAFGRNRLIRTIKSEENQKLKSEELDEPSFEMAMKTEHDSDDEFDQEDLDLNYKDLDSHNDDTYVQKQVRKKRNKPDEKKVGKREKRAEKRMNEEFDETILPSIEEKIRSFEQQIIPNPTNASETKINKNIERNIALQQAYREIVTTGCSNRKAASKVHKMGKLTSPSPKFIPAYPKIPKKPHVLIINWEHKIIPNSDFIPSPKKKCQCQSNSVNKGPKFDKGLGLQIKF